MAFWFTAKQRGLRHSDQSMGHILHPTYTPKSWISDYMAPINTDSADTCIQFSVVYKWGKTHQRELIILQSNSSQHMRRLAWWSARTDGGTRMGSTSQFSSDSYKARMKSPTSCGPHCHYVCCIMRNFSLTLICKMDQDDTVAHTNPQAEEWSYVTKKLCKMTMTAYKNVEMSKH